MDKPQEVIQNVTDLHRRIMHLNSLKEEQELMIKADVRELMYTLHPLNLIKRSLYNFLKQPESGSDKKLAGTRLVRDLIVTGLTRKKNFVKGFISSWMLKTVTDFIITRYPDAITNGIYKLGSYFKKPATTIEDNQ